MPDLDPEVVAVLERVKREAPKLRSADLTFAESRALRKKETPAWLRLPLRDMARVEDRDIPGKAGAIRVRICTPKSGVEGERAVGLFFHTGGFVFSDLDTDDPQCHRIADESGAILVSVEYRLAPEDKFPAAYEDAVAAWDWVVKHARELGGDGKRFIVCGGSAGGNLTAGVCRHARDSGGPVPTMQVVFVGAFNHPGVPSHAMHNVGGSGQAYSNMLREAYRRSPDDAQDVRYAPLIATEFKNFPRAMIIVAQCDAFCDEGKLYAEKLREAGVPVELVEAKGQIHQVFSWSGAFSMGPKLIDQAAAAMREALQTKTATNA
ncbi:MAG: alpha/beta hydrolase [Burkholderiales bacterium]